MVTRAMGGHALSVECQVVSSDAIVASFVWTLSVGNKVLFYLLLLCNVVVLTSGVQGGAGDLFERHFIGHSCRHPGRESRDLFMNVVQKGP